MTGDQADKFKRNRIVLDWDGTLVESAWPGMGDWMPGAIEAVKRLHNAGYQLFVYSCRLNPYEAGFRGMRDKGDLQKSINEVRAKLDDAGLRYVEIWTMEGKPPAQYYIDDHAERYNGHVHSWKRLVDKILIREDKLEPDLQEHWNVVYPTD